MSEPPPPYFSDRPLFPLPPTPPNVPGYYEPPPNVTGSYPYPICPHIYPNHVPADAYLTAPPNYQAQMSPQYMHLNPHFNFSLPPPPPPPLPQNHAVLPPSGRNSDISYERYRSSQREKDRHRVDSRDRVGDRYRRRERSESSDRYSRRSYHDRSPRREQNRYRREEETYRRSRDRHRRSRDRHRRSRDRHRRSRSSSRHRSRRASRDYYRYASVSPRRERISKSRSRSRSPPGSFRSPSCSLRSTSRSLRSPSGSARSNTREKERRSTQKTEKEILLDEFRRDYCTSSKELIEKLNKWAKEKSNGNATENVWVRSSPADLYYSSKENSTIEMKPRLSDLCDFFNITLIERGRKARPLIDEVPPLPLKGHTHQKHEHSSSSSSSEEEEEIDDEIHGASDRAMRELERKQTHPRRLHLELWHNSPGEMNSGPLCRCSKTARQNGVRHGIYVGEPSFPKCDPHTNNLNKLFHYTITVSPPTNFLVKSPTIISHDEHEFLFSGFSLFSHYKLDQLPPCKVIRFNIEYTILYVEEKAPTNFCVTELQLFEEFLFTEILELYDLDLGKQTAEHCSQFHIMPRFVRTLPENGQEVLSMCEVLKYLLEESRLLVPSENLERVHEMDNFDWQRFVDMIKGTIVTKPGMKPCSLRVDQLDRSEPDEPQTKTNLQPNSHGSTSDIASHDNIKAKSEEKECHSISIENENNPKRDHREKSKDIQQNPSKSSEKSKKDRKIYESKPKKDYYPEIVHFGIRPPQLSYAGNPEYQKAWRNYVKLRHLVANMKKPSIRVKQKLKDKEVKLQEMRTNAKMKRDVTAAVSAEGFYSTGLACDIIQHAMLVPVLVRHLRFHKSLDSLESNIDYKFQSRSLLQMAFTHPSYRENFGTNPDHARNTLTNCGIRQPEYGDRKIHYINTRKRGINTLIDIMSRFGKKSESESAISHNERLEFLGDAVVEFLSSIHLFQMFPGLAEGGLATYRAAIVQNQHLALLAEKLNLEKYMLYAHGSDLCRPLELRHAMANCFEALMGALFIDGGILVADRVFSFALFKDNPVLHRVWTKFRKHPLQEQEPLGDRKYIPQFPFLQRLTEFENSIGVTFRHIRLLAKAFTDRSVGITNLTLGSNQRLEFLGDTVLQLLISDKLYKHFPDHHEGHLSLLRSSLVNNRTQAQVCNDLAMSSYAHYSNSKGEPSLKDKADLLEAFLGALYIDKSMARCKTFCDAVLFPRLQQFIMTQDWNDPKSKLQQCCLTLRSVGGGEPDIPIYKVIECLGPTNTRVYTVAVYFRGKRLASARGHSIQEAEMNAAQEALRNANYLFPQLDRRQRVVSKSSKGKSSLEGHKRRHKYMDISQIPKAYRLDEDSSSTESDENYPTYGTNEPKDPSTEGDDSDNESDPNPCTSVNYDQKFKQLSEELRKIDKAEFNTNKSEKDTPTKSWEEKQYESGELTDD